MGSYIWQQNDKQIMYVFDNSDITPGLPKLFYPTSCIRTGEITDFFYGWDNSSTLQLELIRLCVSEYNVVYPSCNKIWWNYINTCDLYLFKFKLAILNESPTGRGTSCSSVYLNLFKLISLLYIPWLADVILPSFQITVGICRQITVIFPDKVALGWWYLLNYFMLLYILLSLFVSRLLACLSSNPSFKRNAYWLHSLQSSDHLHSFGLDPATIAN